MRSEQVADGTPLPPAEQVALAFALVDRSPHDPRFRFALWQALVAAGKAEPAEAVFDSFFAMIVRDADALTGFGQLCLHHGHLTEAGRLFERALAIMSQLPQALIGLAAVNEAQGDQLSRISLLERYARAMPVAASPYEESRPAVTLTRCLLSARYSFAFDEQRGFREQFSGGHFAVDTLIERDRFNLTTLNLAGSNEPLAAAPSCGVLVNTIACADRGQRSLMALAGHLLANPEVDCINHPDVVLRNSRARLPEQLRGLSPVECPDRLRLTNEPDRAGIVRSIETRFGYPCLLQSVGTGDAIRKAARRAELLAFVDSLAGGVQFDVIAYTNARDAHGMFRRARAFLVAGQLYPESLIGSDRWPMRSSDRQRMMADDARLQDEEQAYLDDPTATLGTERWTALREACLATGLDFVGIDFAPTDDGVLVFQLDPALRFASDHLAGKRISSAFNAMIAGRTARTSG